MAGFFLCMGNDTPMPQLATRKSIIYIDGFNLYYGAIKGSPHKWLDLEKFFTLLRQHDDIQQIYYFTAWARGPAVNRQQPYLRALETLPLVTTVVSRHKRKRFECRVNACTHAGSRFYSGVEEKRTDVAIAVQMVDDAYNGLCDTQVLVSGDSDLVPALDRIRENHPQVRLIAYIPARGPARGAATEVRAAVHQHRTLPLALLSKCHLPNPVLANGTQIHKPASW